MYKDPEVTIGCPVRDRGWILPLYLDSLYKLDYPKELISLVFVLNDSEDNSEDLLETFKANHLTEYKSIDIYELNLKADKDIRGKDRIKIYSSLAEVRNYLLSKLETEYFFSIDSDILVPPNALRQLLKDNKDIVSGVISNDTLANPQAKYPNVRGNIMILERVKNSKGEIQNRLKHYKKYPLNSLFRVYLTGAVYLMTRDVYTKCRYAYHEHGEDIPFCEEANKLGFQLWADSRIFCHHVMVAFQFICRDCVNNCKAFRVYNNQVNPQLKSCNNFSKKV